LNAAQIEGDGGTRLDHKSDGPERWSGPSLDTSDRAGEEQPEAGIKFCGRSFVPLPQETKQLVDGHDVDFGSAIGALNFGRGFNRHRGLIDDRLANAT
jgi:hypothetical protein